MKTKYFKDTSIFQDVIEFKALDNTEYRCMKEGIAWGVYELDGNSYIRCATVVMSGKATPRKLYDAIDTVAYNNYLSIY
jgi:hypothetical protein